MQDRVIDRVISKLEMSRKEGVFNINTLFCYIHDANIFYSLTFLRISLISFFLFFFSDKSKYKSDIL